MSEQAAQMNERFATIAGEAVAAIAIHSDSINDTLSSRLNTFEETFATRGGALVSTLAAQTTQLGSQLETFERLVGEGGESAVERDRRLRRTPWRPYRRTGWRDRWHHGEPPC